MASRLRIPILALAGLSTILSLAIIGTSGTSLHTYDQEHETNWWYLPPWPGHFDTRGAKAQIGTSAAVVVLNAVTATATVFGDRSRSRSGRQTYHDVPALFAALVAATLAVAATASAAALDARAPGTDTLATWTCRWSAQKISVGQGAPAHFRDMCRETRFAFWAGIPVLLLQVALVGMVAFSVWSRSPVRGRLGLRGDAEEKGHRLGSISPPRQISA